ncbi:AAA-type ATPase lid domain-containing protein, partial [Corallococcus exiguus]
LLERLTAHPWPGNVRELENALESAVVLSADGTLDLELLPGGASTPTSQANTGTTLREKLDAHERELILAALSASKGQRTEAAKALGIGRATLHDKLRKHGLLNEGEEPEQ